jgi:hypothetical protein
MLIPWWRLEVVVFPIGRVIEGVREFVSYCLGSRGITHSVSGLRGCKPLENFTDQGHDQVPRVVELLPASFGHKRADALTKALQVGRPHGDPKFMRQPSCCCESSRGLRRQDLGLLRLKLFLGQNALRFQFTELPELLIAIGGRGSDSRILLHWDRLGLLGAVSGVVNQC